jgi:hypothetical protein
VNRRPVPVLVVPAVALLAALALGVVGAPLVGMLPAGPSPARAPVEEPAAGGSVCLTGAGAMQPEADLLLLAAPTVPAALSPDAPPDVTDGTEARARGVLLAFGDQVARTAIGPIEPGALEQVRFPLGVEGWTWTGWADHPLTVWHEWRSPGGPGEPRGIAAARCLPTDPPVQTVLGLRTDGGNEALLRLANPFQSDATFAVTFITLDGTVEPVALRNVSVSGGERVTVRLNDHVPEESDVAAVITVGAGRLAVEGLQRSIAALGDVEGISVVPAVSVLSTTWTVPWLQVGPDVEGAIWILNPQPRPVIVEITLHTAQGATVPEDFDSVEVRAGSLLRVDAADLDPTGRRTFGVTLRSETSGLQVAAGVRFLGDEPERTGLASFAAAPVGDPVWSIAGLAAPGRETVLHIVNLGEFAVTPQVEVTALPGPGGDEDAPDAARNVVLEPPAIAPGAVARVILPLDGARAWSAVVSGGPALVVSRTTLGRDPLEPVVTDATASWTWRTPERALGGRSLDGWVSRLGTDRDLRRDPRIAVRTN